MWSQRSTECVRRRSGRLRRARWIGADGSVAERGACSSLPTATILDTRPPDLLVARQVRGHRLRRQRNVLLHELRAPVLARRLDHDTVVALMHDGAAIVAAVPRHRVLARQ